MLVKFCSNTGLILTGRRDQPQAEVELDRHLPQKMPPSKTGQMLDEKWSRNGHGQMPPNAKSRFKCWSNTGQTLVK
jgi:hypothetical protein